MVRLYLSRLLTTSVKSFDIMAEELTYEKSGVDISKADLIKKIKAEILRESFETRKNKIGEVVSDFGAPAALLDLFPLKNFKHPLLAIHTDGVGTKLVVAQMMNKYDTIGIDCVAANVNDVICLGAEPLSMVSYEAYYELFEPEIMKQITNGLLEGAKLAKISIPGGETAILKDLLQTNRFDLAGTVIGVVEKEKLITSNNLEDGDVIVGLESSGIHTNGLTLARRALFDIGKFEIDEVLDDTGKTVGEWLLEPTKIYVNEILELINHGIMPKYISHITGSGFSKIMRPIINMKYEIESLPNIPQIFKEIQKIGKIPTEEMFKTFNMGIGMCVYLSKEDVDNAMSILEKFTNFHVLGKCISHNKRQVIIKPHNIII